MRRLVLAATFAACAATVVVTSRTPRSPVPDVPVVVTTSAVTLPAAGEAAHEWDVLAWTMATQKSEQEAAVAAAAQEAQRRREKPSAPSGAAPTNKPTAHTFEGDIPDLIRSVFGSTGDKAVRVAHCESTLNPSAVSPGGGNWGLFQINTVHKDDFEAVTGQSWNEAILDAHWNAVYAFKLSNGGTSWGPWACGGA